MSKWKFKKIIKVVAYPDRGAGNDPGALGFHQSPTFISAYFQTATNLVDRDWGLSKQTFVNPDYQYQIDIPSYCRQYRGNDLIINTVSVL